MRTKLLRLLTLAASLGALCGIFPLATNHSAEATLPGTNGRVAFTLTNAADRNIWTMNATGGDRQQLSSGPHTDYTPSWSPDGTKVIYRTTYDSGPPAGGLRIFTFGTTNDDGIPGTETDFMPKWAPDGGHIIFNEDLGGGQFDIVTMDLSNFQKQNLSSTNDIREFSPVFSPRGDKIAFVAEGPAGSDIWIQEPVINPQPIKLTTTPTEIKSEVDFSPDGQSVVFDFTTDSGVTSHIAKVNVDGSGYTPLTSGNFFDIFPKFSPDGQHIIFERQNVPATINAGPQGPGPDPQVTVMNLNGGNVTPISAIDADGGAPDWQSVPRPTATIIWGDNNCSDAVEINDVTATLAEKAGLNAAGGEATPQGACTYPLGTVLGTSIGPVRFGNVDCANGIDGSDALLILRKVAGFTANLQDCPVLENEVTVTR